MNGYKFKAKDKVRVKLRPTPADADGCFPFNYVQMMAGTVLTIKKIERWASYKAYRVVENEYWWKEDLLEYADEPLDESPMLDANTYQEFESLFK